MYDWNEVPEWVQWAATDEDGDLYWYSHKPVEDSRGWHNENGKQVFVRTIHVDDWTQSLEKRPEAKKEYDHKTLCMMASTILAGFSDDNTKNILSSGFEVEKSAVVFAKRIYDECK